MFKTSCVHGNTFETRNQGAIGNPAAAAQSAQARRAETQSLDMRRKIQMESPSKYMLRKFTRAVEGLNFGNRYCTRCLLVLRGGYSRRAKPTASAEKLAELARIIRCNRSRRK